MSSHSCTATLPTPGTSRSISSVGAARLGLTWLSNLTPGEALNKRSRDRLVGTTPRCTLGRKTLFLSRVRTRFPNDSLEKAGSEGSAAVKNPPHSCRFSFCRFDARGGVEYLWESLPSARPGPALWHWWRRPWSCLSCGAAAFLWPWPPGLLCWAAAGWCTSHAAQRHTEETWWQKLSGCRCHCNTVRHMEGRGFMFNCGDNTKSCTF